MKFHTFTLNKLLKQTDLLKIAQVFADEEGTCLLYSATSYETANSSFLFLFPIETIKIHDTIQERHLAGRLMLSTNESNPWDAMCVLGSDIGNGNECFPDWVGFFGYEMGAFSDKDRILPYRKAVTPDAYWQRCAVTLVYNHESHESRVRVLDERGILNGQKETWLQKLSVEEGWSELLRGGCAPRCHSTEMIQKSASETCESYIEKVKKALGYIRKGDIYQLNLSQQYIFEGQFNAYNLFVRLLTLNPAPFSGYFFLKDFTIISSSPERFLQSKDKILETRPIKGTAPRGKTPSEDEANKSYLLTSEKEKAELTMITDLMRNDLGKISLKGSVKVPLFSALESYQNVFHLYSIVRSQLAPAVSPIDAIRACFPGGSISGCPKLRAMEVIDSLEQRSRGIYTGSIGYFSCSGDFDLNIAIRTLVVLKDEIHVQLGGGIVIDSDPQKEYEETQHKGQSIFESLKSETS